MAPSYVEINYNLRPRKNIQRKMLAEVFRRLPFGTLESYRYVGLGSTYFTDFALFHKELGIRNMVSIEKEIEDAARFRFNRPYQCIRLEFGHTNLVLPTLPWRTKTILWLDYDYKLDASVLTDIRHFCANARPGSVIVVTSDASPDSGDRVTLLRKRLGRERIPADVTHSSLAEWGTAAAYQRIITNEVLQLLSERSEIEPTRLKLRYKQLFNFRYSDGKAMMATVGGVVYLEGQAKVLERCHLEKHFRFVRTSQEAFLIEAPNLTFRELHFLDSQLPVSDPSRVRCGPISTEDVKRYASVYRYFPRFTESEI
jgi:hypothetical protein